MKKMMFGLGIAAAALCAVVMTSSCEKKSTPGEKLDNAIESTSKGVHNFTKKAEDAAEKTNDKIQDAIDDMKE